MKSREDSFGWFRTKFSNLFILSYLYTMEGIKNKWAYFESQLDKELKNIRKFISCALPNLT